MPELNLDIHVTRGGSLESAHVVHGAVVDASGALLAHARDPARVTHWRSCAKPFQVMPFVQEGGFEALGWGDEQLALACASHGGEPEHVALAASMLAGLGLDESALACGPLEPLSTRGAQVLRDAGASPTRLHNNCSGKHSAMLARAKSHGWPLDGYHRPDHPIQQACVASVSRWTGVPDSALGRGVDGCGVVEFALPLRNMATAYARLADAAGQGDAGPRRVLGAIAAHPFLLGGTDRFDTILIQETGGRVISKVGAEGVHTALSLDRRIGVVVKAEDGGTRAQYPAMLRALQYMDVLPAELPPRLAAILRRPILNTRGEVVGEIGPVA
ncbi:MAG TPA: asparaginase [Gemmatimonadaceae bacterium]|nr:asparaginase [Gemmatimonadaceae bacterium]